MQPLLPFGAAAAGNPRIVFKFYFMDMYATFARTNGSVLTTRIPVRYFSMKKSTFLNKRVPRKRSFLF